MDKKNELMTVSTSTNNAQYTYISNVAEPFVFQFAVQKSKD